MDYKVIEKSGFIVAGLSLRTSKTRANQEVAAMWMEFFTNKVKYSLKNACNQKEVLGVYFEPDEDYKRNQIGSYVAMATCRVHTKEGVPENLVTKEIPSGKYAVFTARGKFPNITIDTWHQIFESDIERAFGYDFEIYKDLSDPEDVEIRIFVSIV